MVGTGIENLVAEPSRNRDDKEPMRLTVDQEANAVYLYLSNAEIEETREISPNLNYDMSIDGTVVGVEVLEARSWFGDLDGLTPENVLAKVLAVQKPTAMAA